MVVRPLGILLGILIGLTRVGAAQTYTLTDLGAFIPQATNDDGVIAGNLHPSTLDEMPAVWREGTIEFLPFDTFAATAMDLSEIGEVVGDAHRGQPNPLPMPAYWYNGGFFPLPTLSAGVSAHATGISPTAGVLTGYGQVGSQGTGFQVRAWRRWSDGTLDILPTLGGMSSIGYDANDAGEIIGDALRSSGFSRATRWDVAGVPADLGTLGGPSSSGTAILADGTAVGHALTAGLLQRAFRTVGAGMILL
jgi:uncharacterized membrane protein